MNDSPEDQRPDDNQTGSEELSEEGNGFAQFRKRGSPVSFPVVGLGASAGGLAAFRAFFKNMPAEPGMAFIILQHLDPHHESMLDELLQSNTSMPVSQAENRMVIDVDHIYVTPPGYVPEIRDRHIYLHKVEPGQRPYLPIDRLFRSLAEDFGEAAMGVLLSGTGSDGTLGLKAIKEVGGMVAIQDLESAEFPGMPASAMHSNAVDIVAPPAELPGQLVEYVQLRWDPDKAAAALRESMRAQLRRIFNLLEEMSGHDFQGYKENMLLRRIEHRMAVNHLWQVEDYVNLLEENSEERESLFRELLIGVTHFFRDIGAFDALEREVLPKLLKGKRSSDTVRVWVAGCSTGEEVYSLAIVLWEAMQANHVESKVQIFATDIDERALSFARRAVYPENIAADVPPAYLERFFHREDSVYAVNKPIRDMVIFANQDLTRDPPFSRLDLISCRNLLIYLGTETQRRLIPMFHYALRPRGYLFLGSAETLNEFDYLFEAIDREWKIFRRLEAETPSVFNWASHRVPRFESPRGKAMAETLPPIDPRQVAEQFIMAQYGPTTYVVINRRGEVLHFHTRTGRYLEHPRGAPTANVMKLARAGLNLPLAAAIRQATNEGRSTIYEDVTVQINGGEEHLNLAVHPLNEPGDESELYIVVFERIERAAPPPDQDVIARKGQSQQRVAELERELHMTRQYLQTTINELEETNEELQSSYEELQSANEELQSTNEELKTDKEELQSVNEELVTVNHELQGKIDQLARSNSDLNDLLTSIEVAIIFLDLDLHIQRFNRAAGDLLNLIGSDVGRPLSHIATNLQHERLVADARQVLDTLVPRDRELRTEEGTWFSLLLRPYRTLNNVIDGVVMTFSEITQQKELEQELRLTNTRFNTVLRGSPIAVFNQDRELRYTWVNNAEYFFAHQNVIGKRDVDLMEQQADGEKLEAIKQRVLKSGRGERETVEVMVRGEVIRYDMYVEPLRDEDGEIVGITGVTIHPGENGGSQPNETDL
jgi:two-component system CheB/CheR fusion protein